MLAALGLFFFFFLLANIATRIGSLDTRITPVVHGRSIVGSIVHFWGIKIVMRKVYGSGKMLGLGAVTGE